MKQVRKDGSAQRRKDEAERESTDQTSPGNTALGILRHFRPVRKTDPEILKYIKIKQ